MLGSTYDLNLKYIINGVEILVNKLNEEEVLLFIFSSFLYVSVIFLIQN